MDMMRIAGAAAVAAWLVMAAMLAQRAHVPVAAGPASAIRAGEEWMGIYLNGKKVGYSVDRVKKTPDGYDLTEKMALTLTVMGSAQEVHTVISSKVDDALALKDFDFSLKSGVGDTEVKGAVAGRLLKLRINSAGAERMLDLPLKDTPHLSEDLELLLRKEKLAPGMKLRLPFFDPATLSEDYMDVTVEAREELKVGENLLPVYRIREDFAGVSATEWVNPEIGAVKGKGIMGFTFLRETREQAAAPPAGGYESADLIAMASIPVKGALPEPRNASFLKARLSGADFSGLDLAGGRQGYKDGVVSVTKETTEGMPGVSIPIKDPALQAYLRPSPYVQSDDPGIRKKAQDILSGETDALRAAKKLSDWVYANLKKQAFAGIPSAVEVLKNLSGDCKEHTVLYAALARSAGLPAKMDAGVVMMGGRFYYHAWPEVYAGRWISVDPTFGQFPADAAHIRLVEGGLDKDVLIAKVMGKLQIEILKYK